MHSSRLNRLYTCATSDQPVHAEIEVSGYEITDRVIHNPARAIIELADSLPKQSISFLQITSATRIAKLQDLFRELSLSRLSSDEIPVATSGLFEVFNNRGISIEYLPEEENTSKILTDKRSSPTPPILINQ